MNLKGEKFLITGGSGFIGTNLQKKLKSLNSYFEVFDKSQGQDIENKKQLATFIKKNFDVIFHLAGYSGAVKSNREMVKSFQINTFSTENLCSLILKYSPNSKLILSSSRLEYGKPKYLPVDENHPTEPTSIYGLSKLASTQIALMHHKTNGLKVTVFRTSNVYGPHKNGDFTNYNIINYFIDQAVKNRLLTIYGDGEQKRDYLFIDDLTSVFIKAAQSDKTNGQIYNLGYGKGIKFKKMAELIIQTVGKGRLKFVKWPDDFKSVETGDYVSDISKIKKELGFSPKYNFENGIEKTLEI